MNEKLRHYHENNLQRRAEKLCSDIRLPEVPTFRFIDRKQNLCVMNPDLDIIDISLIDYYYVSAIGNVRNTQVHELMHGLSLFYNDSKKTFQAKDYVKTVPLENYYESLINHKIYDETLAVYGGYHYGEFRELTVPKAKTWQVVHSVNRYKADALDLITSGVFERSLAERNLQSEKSCMLVFENAVFHAEILGNRIAELLALHHNDLSLRGMLFVDPELFGGFLQDQDVKSDVESADHARNLIEASLEYQTNK